jgi:hypothetical protein
MYGGHMWWKGHAEGSMWQPNRRRVITGCAVPCRDQPERITGSFTILDVLIVNNVLELAS